MPLCAHLVYNLAHCAPNSASAAIIAGGWFAHATSSPAAIAESANHLDQPSVYCSAARRVVKLTPP
jgi:hypothetical protein